MTENNTYSAVVTAKCPKEYSEVLQNLSNGYFGVISEPTIIKLFGFISKINVLSYNYNYLKFVLILVKVLLNLCNKSVKLSNSMWIQHLCCTHLCYMRQNNKIQINETAVEILAELHSIESQNIWCIKFVQYVNAMRSIATDQLGCISKLSVNPVTIPQMSILSNISDDSNVGYGSNKALRVCKAFEAYSLVICKVIFDIIYN